MDSHVTLAIVSAVKNQDFWAGFRATIKPDKFGCVHGAAPRDYVMRYFSVSVIEALVWLRTHKATVAREMNRALRAQGWQLRRKQAPTGYTKAEPIA